MTNTSSHPVRMLQRALLLGVLAFGFASVASASNVDAGVEIRSNLRATTAATTAITNSNSHNHQQRSLQADDGSDTSDTSEDASNLTGIYNIPSFALRFESPNRLSTSDKQDAGDLIASTTNSPLKLITNEFLLESFADELAADITGTIPDMVYQLLSLNLEVTVWHEYSDTSEKNSRDLQNNKMIRFYAEFTGSVYYVPPTASTAAAEIPTDDYIYTLLQKWMETSFRNDHDVLKQMLQESQVPAVSQLQNLEIFMDIDIDSVGQNPFVISDTTNDNAIHDNDRDAKGKVLMSSLILVSCVTVLAIALYVRPMRRKRRRLHNGKQGAFPSPDDRYDTSTLPGRHSDATDILEASDRYLSQHRPDLFQIMSMNSGNGNGSNTSGNKFVQSLASMDGVEYDDDHDHEDYKNDTADANAAGGSTTWWTKLTSSLKHHAVLHAQPRFVNNLVCDEDPGDYPFAFSDFPRHDGTPCLIYSESADGPATLMTQTSSQSASAMSAQVSPISPIKDPPSLSIRASQLSTDEFKEALSQHDTSLIHHHDDDDDDEDGIYNNHFRDNQDNYNYNNQDNIYNDDQDNDYGGESIEVEFTNKLERLVAMRHRHYEKESIMEKHREIRRKERNKAEAYERQLRLRRHEMELDLSEIEATVTSPAAQQRSKKAWHETPENKINGRKMSHRTTSSNPDLLRSGNSTVFDEAIADMQEANIVEVQRVTPLTRSTTNGGYGQTTDSGCHQLADTANGSSTSASVKGMPPKSPATKLPIPASVLNSNPNDSTSGGMDDIDQPIKPSRKNNKRLSHQRSYSHGTNEEKEGENKSNGGSNSNRHRREGSNEEALMTFGIAAYTMT